MSVSPAVGRALVRLAERARPGEQAAQPDTRARILDLVTREQHPMTVEGICERTGLHPNTVRGHLEVLLASGRVQRESAPSRGRGRPAWLYRAGATHSPATAELRAILDAEFGDEPDQSIIDDAAQRWAEASRHRGTADSADAAVAAAVDTLTDLGFGVQTSPAGDEMALTDCPYAELVRDRPVICEIHTSLLAQLLDGTGHSVRVGAMEVFARPGMCIARLRRPDIAPEWTVVPKPRQRKDQP
jgi:predicted ArsR family transcriptional regulator